MPALIVDLPFRVNCALPGWHALKADLGVCDSTILGG